MNPGALWKSERAAKGSAIKETGKKHMSNAPSKGSAVMTEDPHETHRQMRGAPLTWRVFLSEARPVVTTDLPPNLTQQMFPPISATLIVGSEDAVLVDPLLTIEDARALGAWVAATGKNLTTIYA